MKRLILISTLALAGCQTTNTAVVVAPAAVKSEEWVWLRTDGQRASSSPVLLAKFNADKAVIGPHRLVHFQT